MLAWLRGQVSPVFSSETDPNTFVKPPYTPQQHPLASSNSSMETTTSNETSNTEKEEDAATLEDMSMCEVPADFGEADATHIARMLAYLIDRLIAHNDHIPFNRTHQTPFHSRAPPTINVTDYLIRIVRYTSLESACLLSILVYIDRICTRYPNFTITSLTVHRFLIAAVTVASKETCDVYCTNAHYAKVGGISCSELNTLELELLRMIDWQLICLYEELQQYYENLIVQHPAYRLKSRAEKDEDFKKG